MPRYSDDAEELAYWFLRRTISAGVLEVLQRHYLRPSQIITALNDGFEEALQAQRAAEDAAGAGVVV